jgi:hypothetical protein
MTQFASRGRVSGDVCFELWGPKLRPAFWKTATPARWIIVPMPKAAMNENYLAPPWQNQIRRSWQISTVEPESATKRMDQAANGKFRLSVFAAHERHLRATSRVNRIGQTFRRRTSTCAG